MSQMIETIWIITGVIVLLWALWSRESIAAIFEPRSPWAKSVQFVILAGILVSAFLHRLWQVSLFGVSVTSLASLGLAAWIGTRAGFLMVSQRRANRDQRKISEI